MTELVSDLVSLIFPTNIYFYQVFIKEGKKSGYKTLKKVYSSDVAFTEQLIYIYSFYIVLLFFCETLTSVPLEVQPNCFTFTIILVTPVYFKIFI